MCMPMQYFIIVLTGFLSGVFLVTLLKKFSLSHNLLIAKGIPLVGGIGLGLSFLLISLSILFIYRGLSREIIGLIVSSGLMLAFGVIDDWKELSVQAKFLVQIIATSLLIFFGIRTEIVYIGKLFNIIITFVWVLGITNALNHLDVMDGVASGTAIIVSCAFFIISFLHGDTKTAILALILAGAVFSVFLYNFPPAKIYMGNSGSHFLGFVLAAIALILSYAPLERKAALLSPLLILGFPVFDTTFLILTRIIKQNLPFNKSNDHLTLRFLTLGHSKKRTLFIMLGLCLFFCLSGILVSQVSNLWGIGTVALAVFISLAVIIKINKVVVNG